jgi:NAD(P)-dependent dehydrogenase (short-subunit alcohol dehydrogenase family)
VSAVEEQAVVITGANGQVGSAVVRRLRGHAPLALLGRGREDAAGDPSEPVSYFAADLGDEASVQATAREVRAKFGGVRGLVHTVGGYAGGVSVADQSLDTVRKMFELNVVTSVNVVKAFLPDLIASEHGRIVLFASAAALRGPAGSSAYAASKAALLRYAEALSEEVAAHGVYVRVIAPTTIDTPVNRKAMPSGQFADWVTLPEIADTVAFLLDPQSTGIRFAVLPMGR